MNGITAEEWLSKSPTNRPWISEPGVNASVTFASLWDYVAAAEGGSAEYANSHQHGDTHWRGTSSFEEAAELARKGWHDGAERISALADAIRDKVGQLTSHKVARYVEDDGHAIDIERYLIGEPEHWLRIEDRIVDNPGGRVLRIAHNSAASAGVGADAFIGKGAAAAALVLTLDELGYPCEVLSTFGAEYGSEYVWSITTVLKQASDPLDVLSLAFSFAHPAKLRRMDFALSEQLPNRRVAEKYTSAHPATMPPGWEAVDVMVERAHYNDDVWTNAEASAAWVVKTLREQGIIESEV